MKTFQENIEKIYSSIDLTIDERLKNRHIDIKIVIDSIFSRFKLKTFNKNEIIPTDIINPICMVINNGLLSQSNIILLNTYIRNLTIYEIDIKYVFKNKQKLAFMSNCEKDKELLR